MTDTVILIGGPQDGHVMTAPPGDLAHYIYWPVMSDLPPPLADTALTSTERPVDVYRQDMCVGAPSMNDEGRFRYRYVARRTM